MNRTLILALGAVLLAGAAQAGEYSVSTAGKTPAQVRTSIADAAAKACKSAYDGDPLDVYIRPACERAAFKSGVSSYERQLSALSSPIARRAPAGDAVVASR